MILGVREITRKWRKKHGGANVKLVSIDRYFEPTLVPSSQEDDDRVLRPYIPGETSLFGILQHVTDLIGELDIALINARSRMPEMEAVAQKPANFAVVRENLTQARWDAIRMIQCLQEALDRLEEAAA